MTLAASMPWGINATVSLSIMYTLVGPWLPLELARRDASREMLLPAELPAGLQVGTAQTNAT